MPSSTRYWRDCTLGDLVNNGSVFVGTGSKAVFVGHVSGAGAFPGGGTAEFVDGFSPGNSPAAVSFGGDVVFASTAKLHMEIGGPTPGAEYDQVFVAGHATFDGKLSIEFIDGFVPQAGQTFTFFTAETQSGTFDSVTIENGPPGLTFSLDPTRELTIITSALPGDIDLSGSVNRADVALFAQHLGRTSGSTWASGDFDGDGMTTLNDLALQQANFGATLPSPAASAAAVPEPRSLLLLTAGGMLLAMAAKSGRRRSQVLRGNRSARSA